MAASIADITSSKKINQYPLFVKVTEVMSTLTFITVVVAIVVLNLFIIEITCQGIIVSLLSFCQCLYVLDNHR